MVDDGNIQLNILERPGNHGGDGEMVDCVIAGLTVIFKEKHPRTDWLEERRLNCDCKVFESMGKWK